MIRDRDLGAQREPKSLSPEMTRLNLLCAGYMVVSRCDTPRRSCTLLLRRHPPDAERHVVLRFYNRAGPPVLRKRARTQNLRSRNCRKEYAKSGCRLNTEKVLTTHARTAFISIIAIVFPIHACGPEMKVKTDDDGLYASGRFNQR